MSRITINTNVASLNAERRLSVSTNALGKSFERLSSGLRINRAADDAAGLAIASGLDTDRRVFTQGIRNFNDGLSLLNIAEGGLQEASNIVIRMRELAEQSANGTLANTQRRAINEEADSLVKEFNRIVNSTKYNNLQLIDGSLNDLKLTGGYGANGQIGIALGNELGRKVATGTFAATASFNFFDYDFRELNDFNGDGIVDSANVTAASQTVEIAFGTGNGDFGANGPAYSIGAGASFIRSSDFNNDGVKDLMVGYNGTNYGSVLLGNSDGSFRAAMNFTSIDAYDASFTDFNNDGNLDAIITPTSGTGRVLLGNGNGTFLAAATFQGSELNNFDDSAGATDMDGDGYADIVVNDGDTSSAYIYFGNGNGTFKARVTAVAGVANVFAASSDADFDTGINLQSLADFNNDGVRDIVFADTSGGNATVKIAFGNSDRTFSAPRTITSVASSTIFPTVADFDGDGKSDLFLSIADATSGRMSVMLGNGDGTFKAASLTQTIVDGSAVILAGGAADMNGDGAADLVGISFTDGHAGIFISQAQTVTTLPQIHLGSRGQALHAMSVLDSAMDRIAAEIGAIGSVQSRLSVAVSNLDQATENFRASQSRIVDVDVAEESANLVKNRILQQAGAAILSQANESPALALVLLGND